MWLLTPRFKTSTICFSSFWVFFFYFFAPPRTWFYILSISLSRTRLFFFFDQTHSTHRSKEPSAAYARRPCAQRGSGTCTDSPGSFGEAGCCLLAARSQVGTVCTQSLSRYLGDPKVGAGGGGSHWSGRGRLGGGFRRQGLNMQRPQFDNRAIISRRSPQV